MPIKEATLTVTEDPFLTQDDLPCLAYKEGQPSNFTNLYILAEDLGARLSGDVLVDAIHLSTGVKEIGSISIFRHCADAYTLKNESPS